MRAVRRRHWGSGWMVGTTFLTPDQAGQPSGTSPGMGRRGWRLLALASMLIPLASTLVQCGGSPSASALAANAAVGDSFDDRYPAVGFNERFQAVQTSSVPRQAPAEPSRKRAAPAEPTYQVASLAPQVPYQRPALQEDQTTLVSLKSSAFPYLGNNPRTEQPFLNVSSGERRGHRGLGGRVYW